MFENALIALFTVLAHLIPITSTRSSWLSALVKTKKRLSTDHSTARAHTVALATMKLEDRNMILRVRISGLESRLCLLTAEIERNQAQIEVLNRERQSGIAG